jgi:hypothetical protein
VIACVTPVSEAITVHRRDKQPVDGIFGGVTPPNVPASDVPAMAADVPSGGVPAAVVPLRRLCEYIRTEQRFNG